jgi:hypothetical protein
VRHGRQVQLVHGASKSLLTALCSFTSFRVCVTMWHPLSGRGAALFESLLLDYDVASNWGNWVAAAGLTGGRLNLFNITKQSKVLISAPRCPCNDVK